MLFNILHSSSQQVPASVGSYTVRAEDSASIVLIVEGEGRITSVSPPIDLVPGSVVFIAAATEVQMSCSNDLLMFRAYCSQ